ncbi:hypothetical protein DFH08DRAFT_972257 [Mycena albidolilacea]|uniref:Uncharacterized protein n=1 Tax=Mycena albidolilacea TaxID=1033008 RepID=A0AAD7EDT2_9AGAR|nr:hypothetical protein DFH08DRAFT_972257 [Mycena albidolilacea]
MTNLPLEDLKMDNRGVKDCRYYCLPPYRCERGARPRRVRGFAFHLVAQGHIVGIFDNWIEAKASLRGFPDNSNQGCHTEDECIEVWQRLCRLGVHPHPIDPAFLDPPAPTANATPVANISPRKSAHVPAPAESSDVRVKVEAARSEQRYKELQQDGEEPDLLVTRSFAEASWFALEEDKGH